MNRHIVDEGRVGWILVVTRKIFRLLLPHAVNCVRFCFWRSLWLFCLCMKYLGNRWTDWRQIHWGRENVFGPSLERIWMSVWKVKGQGHQAQKPRHF